MKRKDFLQRSRECLLFYLESIFMGGNAERVTSKFRIYTLTDDGIWYLHYVNNRSMEELSELYECSYRQRLDIKVSFNAVQLMKKIKQGESLLALTGYIIQRDEIIEIDDGHRPVFFYVLMSGIKRIYIKKSDKEPYRIQELYVTGKEKRIWSEL